MQNSGSKLISLGMRFKTEEYNNSELSLDHFSKFPTYIIYFRKSFTEYGLQKSWKYSFLVEPDIETPK